MNRSILIVICDFLLLSLLTFSTDINHMADENTRPPTKVVVSTNAVPNPGNDLAAAMKLALTEERKNTEQLQQQLSAARTAAGQQQTQLSQREQENLRLQQQVAASQTNLENLSRQLQTSSARSEQAQQKLTDAETAAQKASDVAAALRRQLDEMSRSNQLAQAEKDALAGQFSWRKCRRAPRMRSAALLQQEALVAHAENAKLAEGFKTLATNSTQLTQEIRANTPLAPNSIFSEFVSNRVEAVIVRRAHRFFQHGHHQRQEHPKLCSSPTAPIFLPCATCRTRR